VRCDLLVLETLKSFIFFSESMYEQLFGDSSGSKIEDFARFSVDSCISSHGGTQQLNEYSNTLQVNYTMRKPSDIAASRILQIQIRCL
jgi:hypothetical protein